ncbi:MAG TPA: hypothetical protein EYP55_10000 [Anaerolineae bacterium]|nr:hypothetical protein [Anaerolineae bacterium]
MDEMALPLLPTIAPGRYSLIAGVYVPLSERGWQRLMASTGGDAVWLARRRGRDRGCRGSLHPHHGPRCAT